MSVPRRRWLLARSRRWPAFLWPVAVALSTAFRVCAEAAQVAVSCTNDLLGGSGCDAVARVPSGAFAPGRCCGRPFLPYTLPHRPTSQRTITLACDPQ